MSGLGTDFGERERRNADALIAQALAEDLGQVGDITSTATIPSHARGARGWWRGRRACWPACRSSSDWSPSSSSTMTGSRFWPTATPSSRAA